MKPYYELKPEEFIPWLTNFIEIAGGRIKELPITAEQIASLTARRDAMQVKLNAKVAAEQASESATTALGGEYDETKSEFSYFNTTFKANRSIPRALLEELGLNVSDGKTSPPPSEPLNVTVLPNAAGYNEVTWEKNGNKRNTIYVVEAQTAGKPDWVLVGAVNVLRFSHKDQKPGTQVAYRVKATRAGRESAWSGSVVAYYNG